MRAVTSFKILVAAVSLASTTAFADQVRVKIENLTSQMYFTPVLAVAHSPQLKLFRTGEPASAGLQAIAEGGDISIAKAAVENAGAATAAADGLLAPGESVTLVLNTRRWQRYLSLAGMLLPTNDGFAGIDSIRIPWGRRAISTYARGYDAGTEMNNEVVNGGGAPGVLGIPADPGGNAGTGGSGVTTTENNVVHVHRGVLGDRDATGGESDLDSSVHRWLNPVARITVYNIPRRNGAKR